LVAAFFSPCESLPFTPCPLLPLPPLFLDLFPALSHTEDVWSKMYKWLNKYHREMVVVLVNQWRQDDKRKGGVQRGRERERERERESRVVSKNQHLLTI
jgi:hypothetical protein